MSAKKSGMTTDAAVLHCLEALAEISAGCDNPQVKASLTIKKLGKIESMIGVTQVLGPYANSHYKPFLKRMKRC